MNISKGFSSKVLKIQQSKGLCKGLCKDYVS